MLKGVFRRINRKIYCITWSCPRCGRPFTTQLERDLHWMQCGK